jgi:hypothetical protein
MSKTSGPPEFVVARYIRELSVDRALRGLLFVMIGMLATAVPIIQPIGSIVALTGVIWYILGSEPFGKKQSDYVKLAAAIFVIGLGFLLVGSVGFFLFVLSLTNTSLPLWWWGNSALASALIPSMQLILELETVGTIAMGLAYVLFTYYLQRPIGRALLLLAFVANVAISVLVLSILSSSLPSLPNISIELGGYAEEAAHNFANQVLVVGLLNLISAAIYAVAYNDLYSRIKGGQLPPSI